MTKKRIEFGEVHLGEIARKHIEDCFATNHITCGPKVDLLEDKWRRLFDYPYASAVNSGTSAVMACCMALYDRGAKPGDEIIVPALSFIATANAVRAAGFRPVFVDIKRETLNINEELIRDVVTKRTRAIVGVNLMGKPCKMDVIRQICDENNLIFILDNCEAYGSKYKGEYALHYADMECSSHYVAHLILGCEMGIVSSRERWMNDAIRSIRSHGRAPDSLYFNHERFGLNLKPSDLHASIALEGIEFFWETFNKRRDNIRYLESKLEEAGAFKFIDSLKEEEGDINCPHGFSIIPRTFTFPGPLKISNQLKEALESENIHWKRNFGSMPTQHKCFEYLGYQLGDFPDAEYVGDYGIHLGVHQYLTMDDLDRMVNAVINGIGL